MTDLRFDSEAFQHVKKQLAGNTKGVIEVSPGLAGELFRHHNLHNDVPQLDLIWKYTQMILKGFWRPAYDPSTSVGFYKDGRLADGQHRLLAIFYSKQTVSMLIEIERPILAYTD